MHLPCTGHRPADAGPLREVAITVAHARHHLRIIGATGAGSLTQEGLGLRDAGGGFADDLDDHLRVVPHRNVADAVNHP
jgi:hypothetical protein